VSHNYHLLSLDAPPYADAYSLHPTGDGAVGQYGAYPYYGMFLTKLITVGTTDLLGGCQKILPPGAVRSIVTRVNRNDWLVGVARDEDALPRAFAYNNGQYLDLHRLTGMRLSLASDINSSGLALVNGGPGETWEPDFRAFLIDVNSQTVTKVDPLPGDTDVSLVAINSNGVAVGISWGSGPHQWRPVIYEAGTLSVVFPGDGRALDINDKGQVLAMAGWPELPAIFEDGQLRSLPVRFEPRAINNSGTIVGRLDTEHGPAVIYEGGLLDVLTNLCVDLRAGWVIDVAYDIDDRGRIAISAWNPQTTERHSAVLMPAPVDESRLQRLRAAKFLRVFGGVTRDGGGPAWGPRGPTPIGPWGP
jgi:hypothetical protein